MKHSCVVIDKFLDEPMYAREFGLQTPLIVKTAEDGPIRRGLRSEYLHNIFPRLYSEIVHKVSNVIGINSDNFEFRTRYQITNGTWRPWVHKDNSLATVLIYLNINTPQNSGTSLYLPRSIYENKLMFYTECKNLGNSDTNYRSSEEYESKRLFNNGQFSLDISVEGVFNRAVFISGSRYHSATSFFGNSKYDSRMTIACFVIER